jgi:DNA-binding response OmpR family regulator
VTPGGGPSRVTGLGGLRVFVVEDEFLLSLSLEEDLAAVGCVVVGPFSTLAGALEASSTEQFDLAILDVNLNGEPIFPLADQLGQRGKPFILLTGYGAADLPERFATAPRVGKPYEPALLLRELRRTAPKSA